MQSASVATFGLSPSCRSTSRRSSSWYDCRTHIIQATSHRYSMLKPDCDPLSLNLVMMSVLIAWHSVSCCTLHLAKALSTRITSAGRSSRTRAHVTCAADVKRSRCTSRISERIVSSAASWAGPKVLCLARAERPTATKKRWSAWPSDISPARQQFSSCGAISISREGSSAKHVLENSFAYSEKRSLVSAFHIKNALMSCANCVLVHSRSLAASSRLTSERNSPWYMPIKRSILCTNSAICSGASVGNLVKIALPTSSISAGVVAVMTFCSRAPSHSPAARPTLASSCSGACDRTSGRAEGPVGCGGAAC
mmetsp:Transcript_66438/g.203321  ORF Transcript_66438/g.203321 Transcript_66438/m.203321 type:complete len:310 (-) Transcript_66438:131-1060(-)